MGFKVFYGSLAMAMDLTILRWLMTKITSILLINNHKFKVFVILKTTIIRIFIWLGSVNQHKAHKPPSQALIKVMFLEALNVLNGSL